MMNSKEVDLSGMRCPMPIVHLRKVMKELEVGDEIIAMATDPAFCLDVEAWCRRVGHELLGVVETDEHLVAKIRKADKGGQE